MPKERKRKKPISKPNADLPIESGEDDLSPKASKKDKKETSVQGKNTISKGGGKKSSKKATTTTNKKKGAKSDGLTIEPIEVKPLDEKEAEDESESDENEDVMEQKPT